MQAINSEANVGLITELSSAELGQVSGGNVAIGVAIGIAATLLGEAAGLGLFHTTDSFKHDVGQAVLNTIPLPA